MHLRTRWFASFLIEAGNPVDMRPFPKEPGALADRLSALYENEVLDEERELAKIAQGSESGLHVSEPRLMGLDSATFDDGRLEVPLPEEYGYSMGLLHEAMLMVGRERLRGSITPDLHLIQAVASLDDLQSTTNLLSERIRDWYGMHFPQLENMVEDARYIELLVENGDRPGIIKAHPDLAVGPELGGDIGEGDLERLREMGQLWKRTREMQGRMEEHIGKRAAGIAPNMSGLVGPMLAARLIRLGGGLGRLARMPSSTIQLLGAEKALFRSMRDGSRGPKHGVIFLHPFVNATPYWARGKAARALAGKISVAARVDSQGGVDMSDRLRKAVERRVGDIREQARRKGPPRLGTGRNKGRGKGGRKSRKKHQG